MARPIPRVTPFALALTAGLLVSPLFAQQPTTAPALYPNPHPDRYLFEDQIHPGMKGYGLTVMHGNKIEKFSVEVIDVIQNFSPSQNVVLVKCSGLGLEESGIIAGMSGSPVFINDKMIGAVAYGWGFSKEPIGGVQPIRQMLGIKLPALNAQGLPVRPDTASNGGAWNADSTSPWLQTAMKTPGFRQLATHLGKRGQASASLAGHAVPERPASLKTLASPMMVSAASPQAMAFIRSAFAHSGIVPLESGAAGSTAGLNPLGGPGELKPTDVRLEPGSALAIPLLSGDLDLSVIGTVTEVADDHVYAFGHAFLAEGASGVPISTGYIYTILPSVQESFKLGSSFQPAGALLTDEQTGIVGAVGPKPATIPVEVAVRTVDGAVNNTYHYQMADHPKGNQEIPGTADITGAALVQSVTAQRNLPHDYTLHLTGSCDFRGDSVPIDMLATSGHFDPAEALLPVALLTDNPYQNQQLTHVKLSAVVDPVDREAAIQSVTLDQAAVAPGQKLIARIQLAPVHAPARTVKLELPVPADTPEGIYQLTVGSSDMMIMQEANVFPDRYAPETAKELSTDIKHLLSFKRDRLYAQLVLDLHGVAAHGQELKNLPMSRVLLVAQNAPADAYPDYNTLDANIPVPDGNVVEGGGQTFDVTVDKNATKRFFRPTNLPHKMPESQPQQTEPSTSQPPPPPPAGS